MHVQFVYRAEGAATRQPGATPRVFGIEKYFEP